MKTLCRLMISLLAAGFLAETADAAVLYRGRLGTSAASETTFDEGASYRMTFRLYAERQGGTALYTLVTNGVPLDANGRFEVLLGGAAVDEALTNEAGTCYVGLALDDQRELMPRRQILDLPRALRARLAEAPAANGRIDTLEGATLSTGPAVVRDFATSGKLTTLNTNDTLAVPGFRIKAGETFDLTTRDGLQLLGDMKTLVKGVTNVSRGAELAKAPADGLAFVCTCTRSSANLLAPSMGGVTRLCLKGEAIRAPVSVGDDEEFAVTFFSFKTK